MQGLMQETPLTVGGIFRRAETLWPTQADGHRRAAAVRAHHLRRLGRRGPVGSAAPSMTLGVSPDGRVATFAWNSARHLELYFAAPCTGRVLHTLNIRLFADQLVYIANHAEDEVIFVDRSLLPHAVAAHRRLQDGPARGRDGRLRRQPGAAEIPDDARILDYEELVAAADRRIPSTTSPTRTRPRRCATPAAPPVIPKGVRVLPPVGGPALDGRPAWPTPWP